MQTVVIKRIAQKYGLPEVNVLTLQKGYRNQSYSLQTTAGLQNFILYKQEPGILERIKRANSVADYASLQGLPTRKTASSRIVRLRQGDFQKYGALYTYLPGGTIPWEAYTQKHIKLLGGALSTLHARVRNLPQNDVPNVEEEYIQILDRMQQYFADPGVIQALKSKLTINPAIELKRLQKLLQLTPAFKDRQILHMDFVRSNILFGSAKDYPSSLRFDDLAITGILDFEKTAYGPRLFDIARTLAFLLVDCKFKSEVKVRKYFLYSGYQKRGEMKLPSLRLLEELINLFLLHDFYKFLRHNPYESLAENEHYLRTRDLLVRRKVLTT